MAEGHGLLCFVVVSLTGRGEWAPKAAASRGWGPSVPVTASGGSRELAAALLGQRNLKNHLVPSPCHGQRHLPPPGYLVICNLIFCRASHAFLVKKNTSFAEQQQKYS